MLPRVLDRNFFSLSVEKIHELTILAIEKWIYFLKTFFARLGKFSIYPEIKASFLALDHFLICFTFDIAKNISVNSV